MSEAKSELKKLQVTAPVAPGGVNDLTTGIWYTAGQADFGLSRATESCCCHKLQPSSQLRRLKLLRLVLQPHQAGFGMTSGPLFSAATA